ncbi:hypothetical protein [Roseococcus sp. SYP-B2431]|uniref:hypothetical protein n=1 Tax=Roseococcus sp. SYP-B2431 TaxID=2496640 RepID=UPI0013F41272|nr:hypothetical protein [Roseococcus sp. SYP-B2431]
MTQDTDQGRGGSQQNEAKGREDDLAALDLTAVNLSMLRHSQIPCINGFILPALSSRRAN